MTLVPEPTPAQRDGQEEARAEPRFSLFLAATLVGDGLSSPVRIRNLSPHGALLEGAALPPPGGLVQLVRGSLHVTARVAWSANGRCGLRFAGTADVQQWRTATSHGEQQRVDQLVQQVRSGAALASAAAEMPGATPLHGTLQDDLRRVGQLLDQLGDALAADDQVVLRHGVALQNLDIAGQMVAALGAHDGDADKLQGLRRSADQAIRRDK